MTPSWSDEFTAMFDLAVYLSAPVDVRLGVSKIGSMHVGVTGCAKAAICTSNNKSSGSLPPSGILLSSNSKPQHSCPLLHIENRNDCHATVAVIAARFAR